MKFIILVFLSVTSIFALSINESLLKIHAVLVPKIYLMDYKFEHKINNNSISIALLYDQVNYKDALSLKDKIHLKYKNGLKDYTVEVNLVLYSDIADTDANIYYLFPTNTKNIKQVIQQANHSKALTFSYQKDDLKHGIMLSLKIGNKIKPIINLDAAKLNKITFRPVLLEISNIYINYKKNILNLKSINSNRFNQYLVLLQNVSIKNYLLA